MLKIKIEPNNLITRCKCHLCSREFESDVVTAALYINGKQGDICPDCFKSIAANGIECPSWEEWEKENSYWLDYYSDTEKDLSNIEPF